jgi:AcrR family transcriptional regulator
MTSRERIDAAALRLLAAHGYDGFSMQEVADAVGLHKSTLFHHYRGKADLVSSVLLQALSRIVEIARRNLNEEPALEDFVRLSEDIVDHFANEPATAKLLLHVVLAPPGSPLRFDMAEDDPLVQLITMLIAWLDRARRCGVIRWVRIRHLLMDVFGVLVFHPAAAEQMAYLAGSEPFSAEERKKRRVVVAAFVRNALAPVADAKS